MPACRKIHVRPDCRARVLACVERGGRWSARLLVACLWLSLSVATALAQGAPGAAPAKGRFLVASDQMLNPDFYRAVILLVSVGQEGALGLIVNRPTPLRLEQALPGVAPPAGSGGFVFEGGPVEPLRLLALFRSSEAVADAERVFDDVYFSADWRLLAIDRQWTADARPLRVFAGYAGWAPGQLEQELAQGAWSMVPAEAAQLFLDRPDGLWHQLSPGIGGQWVRLDGFKAASR